MIKQSNKVMLKTKVFRLWFVLILLYILPFVFSDSSLSLLCEIYIYALAAVSLNLLMGDCGVVSFGHAGFFAVGAYAFGLLSYHKVFSFWPSIILAIFSVLIYAVIVGWFVVRLFEIYFALLLMAFAQIIWSIASVWYSVTGGDDGLTGIPISGWLYSVSNSYYFILTIAIICVAILYLVRESPFGRCLHALRDNRSRAGFIGINAKQYIYIALLISGVFTGTAGILLVIHLNCAFPSYANFHKSGEFLFICLLGGLYKFSGPIVGSFLFVLLNFYISRITEYWPLALGLALVIVALFFRGGVVGFIIDKIDAHTYNRKSHDLVRGKS